MTDHQSPRINAARLAQFAGRTVRLPCKVINHEQPDKAIVEACDGGQVEIQITESARLEGTLVEIIGKVQNDLTIKLLKGLNLDSEKGLDMKMVNEVVELTFDPRFKSMFPS